MELEHRSCYGTERSACAGDRGNRGDREGDREAVRPSRGHRRGDRPQRRTGRADRCGDRGRGWPGGVSRRRHERSPVLTAALLPKMIARGSGAIVIISTAVASASLAEAPVYGATKAALESVTRSWAAAFGANGIRVNTVASGPTRTDAAIDTLGDGRRADGSQTPL